MRLRSSVAATTMLSLSALSCCGEHAGEASESLSGLVIRRAVSDRGTFHFEGPSFLLDAAEGLGPQELDVRVQDYVQPAIALTGTFPLDPKVISEAIGYDLADRRELIGGARLDVTAGIFQRLEAYPLYQRSRWEICDAVSGAVLGWGAAFRPIGLHFRTVTSFSVTLPDVGLYLNGPLAVDPGGVPLSALGALEDR